jgi:hypothetical protein
MTLESGEKTPADVAAELLDYVARAGLWAYQTRSIAESSGPTGELMVSELLDIQQRFRALHLVALVGAGWCDRCGGRLTDPSRSPTGARHCRDCRVGWTLEQSDGRVRAIPQPWPATGPQ